MFSQVSALGAEREMDNHLRMMGKGKSGLSLHNGTQKTTLAF